MGKPAVFWDRDNTLIEDPGYLSDPDQVKLLPGAAEAIRRFSEAGYENIIVTNQSGIARGRFDEKTLEKIHDRLRSLLAEQKARIDAIYYCPYLEGDEAVVAAYRKDSDLRKPKPGMLAKASLERNIELAASWSIGNSIADAQAGRAAGCRTILIAQGSSGQTGKVRDKSVDFTVGSFEEAVETVFKHTRDTRIDQGPVASRHTAPDPKVADGGVSTLLQEILAFLRMVDRRHQAEDFSLARFAGVIVQMVALAALVWAVFGMIRGEIWGSQLVRLMFALVLQMLALTLFTATSKK